MPHRQMLRIRRFAFAGLLFWAVLAVIAPTHAQTVTLLTHDSFSLPEEAIERFEGDTGLELRLLSGGDAGEMVNRALLTRARPIADALFGIDDALIAREGARDLFTPYRAEGIEAVRDDLRFAGDLLTPVTVGYVNFNLDPAALEERGLPLPEDLRDLVREPYHGATVVPDPATSSPGLAFLLTTVARFGEGGSYDWLDYWADLRDADVQVTSGWSDAYYTAFTRYGGDRPIVLSYATSPAAEAIFAEEPPEEPLTLNLTCEACAWRQIEAAGILAGRDRPEDAERVIDFLISEEVQEAVPTSMFVYPVREDVALPDAYDRFATMPNEAQTADLPAERIEREQERWLDQWTEVVRRGRTPEQVR